MFACLLVAQYDTYNVAYMYFSDITAKKTGAKCDTLNTVLALDGGNILYILFKTIVLCVIFCV